MARSVAALEVESSFERGEIMLENQEKKTRKANGNGVSHNHNVVRFTMCSKGDGYFGYDIDEERIKTESTVFYSTKMSGLSHKYKACI